MERKTVNVAQACAIVGVSRRTLYYWMSQNKVQFKRTAGGCRRIFVDSLWRENESVNGEPLVDQSIAS